MAESQFTTQPLVLNAETARRKLARNVTWVTTMEEALAELTALSPDVEMESSMRVKSAITEQ
jgi:hypothetical protein